ncbi:MAG: hypothetical protein CVT88_10325 [Candidatus Altiarchaeales archaeon HGW-Altiarchaeales-1]|nr:MAG: hypothetical protein CVT88_10325 [Candidatus Altiarchaeales archaeon HGW-Altiarchaeales-1]
MQLKRSILKPEYLTALNKEQTEIFNKLAFTKRFDIYLAGGTALTFYLNHRTSADFDFYSSKKLNIAGYFTEVFKKEGYSVTINMDTPETTDLMVGNIHISCFYYPYKLIRQLFSFQDIYVASVEDIAAMKIIAIVQRGKFRDFTDIYFLMRTFGLEKIIEWTKEKYPEYSTTLILKALVYFEDAGGEISSNGRGLKIFDSTLTWTKIKKFIIKETLKFHKNYLNLGKF